jgi:hypothetical protein
MVRAALRREMLLALMRLWDKDPRAVGMVSIAKLCNEDVIEALVADPAGRHPIPGIEPQIKQELNQFAKKAKELVSQYSEGGSHFEVFQKLKTLRDKHLA